MLWKAIWIQVFFDGLCFAATESITRTIAIMTTLNINGLETGYRPIVDLGMDYLRQQFSSRVNFTHSFLNVTFKGERLPDDTERIVAESYYNNEQKLDGQVLLSPCTREQVEAIRITKPLRLLHMCSVGNGGFNLADNPQHISISYYSARSMLEFVVALFRENKWTSITALIDDTSIYSESLHMGMHEQYTKAFNGPGGKYPAVRYNTFHYSLMNGEKDIEERLLKIRESSRIIFLFGSGPSVMRVLTVAKRLTMTNGDYVFIQSILEKKSGDMTFTNDSSWKVTEASSNQSIPYRAFVSNASLLLTFRLQVNEAAVITLRDRVLDRAASKYSWKFLRNMVPTYYYPVYDEFLLYSVVLNETYQETGALADGMVMAERMRNRSFTLPTGELYINEEGERMCDILGDVLDPVDNEYTSVFEWDYRRRKFTSNQARLRALWPGGQWPPPNEPICGFLGNRCIEEEIIKDATIAGATAAVLCFMIAILTVSARQWAHYVQINGGWWKFNDPYDVLDIVPPNTSRSNVSGASSAVNQCISIPHSQRVLHFSKTGQVLWKTPLPFAESGLKFPVTVKLLYLLANINRLRHPNVNPFVGIRTIASPPYRLEVYCKRGSLDDLFDSSILGDVDLMFSIMTDLTEGLLYLHRSDVKFHGNLKSSKCLLDAQFGLKISDIGDQRISELTIQQKFGDLGVSLHAEGRLWTAPEILRKQPADAASDVYSFAIIALQIITNRWPFEEYRMMEQEVLYKIRKGSNPPFRPTSIGPLVHPTMQAMVETCWAEIPSARPQMLQVKRQLAEVTCVMGIQQNQSLFDRLTYRLERYAETLEDTVAERTCQLLRERERCDAILCEMLPRQILDQLRGGEVVLPEYFDEVTISFCDIVGFVQFVEISSPLKVLEFLHVTYSEFDHIIRKRDVYKVETIGDSYMVASGLPIRNGKAHVDEICRMAIDLLGHFTKLVALEKTTEMALRTGIHSGPVAAGVVGLKSPRYCLFGDSVNTASRMETHGCGGKIHLSPSTAAIAAKAGFSLERRGIIDVKGKGGIITFWLISLSLLPVP